MGMDKYLHKSAANSFFRITLIIAALTVTGAVLILSLPAPHPKAVNYVDATREHPPADPLAYPHYSFYSTKRHHIFQFGQLHLVHRSYKKKPKVKAPPPSLPSGPNLSGLVLKATMPGAGKSYAIITGINGGASSLVTLGQTIRQSILVEIGSSHVVLVRNDQNATLSMSSAWEAQAENLMSESGIIEKKGLSYALSVPGDAGDKGGSATANGLGVNLVPLTGEERKDLGISSSSGLTVTRVVRKNTGLQRGDLLLSVSGKPVSSIAQVGALLKNKIGKDVYLTIIRKGKPMNVDFKVP
ncbi:PDZ domain-containing protein [Desulfovibrio sp. JC010]|uniref:PDZ domain-containing protein n=1 Tax=Desulfovibrio sp. JC010 TaxID=2593641 RepID=UPI0013D3C0D3|nr:PDZ domain-containing protein [Desulfovibrio sp. JC010]NDV27661.1 PDZ domain-containing protein [Desulfovibrio sp. JC010]